MRIGLLGGSFNPIHNGHISLADYLCTESVFDEVWLVLSPQNPLKSSDSLSKDSDRLSMLQLATSDFNQIKVCDIELSMSRPSYTINTLDKLHELYPENNFNLIIGSDNWAVFDKWKEHERIISQFGIYIYPRENYSMPQETNNIHCIKNAPLFPISSTQIREMIRNNDDITKYIPIKVAQYITENKLYK